MRQENWRERGGIRLHFKSIFCKKKDCGIKFFLVIFLLLIVRDNLMSNLFSS
jgi:hypothetical protein